ncbi:MAG TPA: sulfite exporter TauE/SafE family protein [Acidobacteriaceae bacterium]
MNELWFALILCLSSLAAGLLGALSGLGGGVVIVPLLTIAFHVDIHYAIGASLVSVIATSSGAAAAYVREGFSNIRVGMFLEIATTLGALVGAWLTTKVPTQAIGVVFGLVLLYSAYASLSKRHEEITANPDRLAMRLRLAGDLPTADGDQHYVAQRVPLGFGLMWMAGALSGLLGIGSGAVKVIAMDQAMRLPFKVSTTTSNFMIGVTAAASAGLYWHSGYMAPSLVLPVMLGVLAGSMVGSRLLVRAHVRTLKIVFSLVIVALGFEMIVHSLTGI